VREEEGKSRGGKAQEGSDVGRALLPRAGRDEGQNCEALPTQVGV